MKTGKTDGKRHYYRGALGTLSIDSDGVVVSKPQVKIIKDAKPTPFYK